MLDWQVAPVSAGPTVRGGGDSAVKGNKSRTSLDIPCLLPVQSLSVYGQAGVLCTCTHAHTHTHTHVCAHTRTHMHTHTITNTTELQRKVGTCKQNKVIHMDSCTLEHHMAHLRAASHKDKLSWEVVSVCEGIRVRGATAVMGNSTECDGMSWCSKCYTEWLAKCACDPTTSKHSTSAREALKHNMQ